MDRRRAPATHGLHWAPVRQAPHAGSTGGLAKGIAEISVRRTTPSTAGMRKLRSFANGAVSSQTIPNLTYAILALPPTARVGSPRGILARGARLSRGTLRFG